MPLYRDGAFVEDEWSFPAQEAALGNAAAAVSKERFLAERETLLRRSAPLGLVLQAGEDFAGLEADVPRFAMIALSFPKFGDGRAYSLARLLRERFAFKGEIRARGDVLRDQIAFMLRAGFSALEVTHQPTIEALRDNAIAAVSIHYQPASTDAGETAPAGARPWLRLSR